MRRPKTKSPGDTRPGFSPSSLNSGGECARLDGASGATGGAIAAAMQFEIDDLGGIGRGALLGADDFLQPTEHVSEIDRGVGIVVEDEGVGVRTLDPVVGEMNNLCHAVTISGRRACCLFGTRANGLWILRM